MLRSPFSALRFALGLALAGLSVSGCCAGVQKLEVDPATVARLAREGIPESGIIRIPVPITPVTAVAV
ncbi:MAG: hypothetical protein H8D78_19915, partial [Chloroflexi bacterium]|nr:hypothetical protein [Chloroflexota bacterium]